MVGKFKTLGLILFVFVATLALLPALLHDIETEELNPISRQEINTLYTQLSKGWVAYDLAGAEDKPLVVMIHGAGTSKYIWDQNFRQLLQAGFRVLRFDLYGHGYSDRPQGEYNLNFFTRQLRELLDALEVSFPVHLIGNGLGSEIAATYVQKFPNQIASFTGIAPLAFARTDLRVLPMIGITPMTNYFIRGFGSQLIQDKVLSGFISTQWRDDFHPKFDQQLKYIGYRHSVFSTLANFPFQKAPQVYKALEALPQVPVQFHIGSDDSFNQTAPAAHLQDWISRAILHMIPNSGHFPQYEQSEEVNALLLDFLKN